MRRIAVLDAPTNLGLRPPTETSVPGCAKAPGALRDHGLLRRLDARDAGCLTPPRYDPGDWRPGDGVCHAPEISAYSRKLADRIGAILDQGEFPVILGGDCSIVLGSALAMHRLGEAVGGRIGLVFVDGHSDFRHPGNASYVGAAAGEDLALVTGRGQTDLAAMEGRRPYYRDIDVVVMGIRAQDEYRLDLQAAGIVTRPVPTLRAEGAARSAQWARDQLVDCAGYWVHVDVDVLDPAVMPAVDAPEPGGIAFPELELLLSGLVESPHCLGVEITVFDPDYDPDGAYAEEITSTIVAGLKAAHAVEARPDLVAARRDLAGPGRLAPAARFGPPAQLASVAQVASSAQLVSGAQVASSAQLVSGAQVDSGAQLASAGSADVGVLAEPAVAAMGLRAEADGSPAVDLSTLSVTGDGLGADERFPHGPGVEGGHPDYTATTTASADDRLGEADGDPAEKDREQGGAAGPGLAAASAAYLDASALPGPADADLDAGLGPDVDPGAIADEFDADEFDADQVSADHDGVDHGGAGHGGVDDGAAGHDGAGQDGTTIDAEIFDRVDEDDDRSDQLDPVEAHRPADDAGGLGPDLDDVRDDSVVRAATRPLGSAPLLDSKPLPATMPGMLRPRSAEEFTLPTQRPAFEVGPEQPADLP